MNQELILILKQIANSHTDTRDSLCCGDANNITKCSYVACECCVVFPGGIEYQPYTIDLGEPNE